MGMLKYIGSSYRWNLSGIGSGSTCTIRGYAAVEKCGRPKIGAHSIIHQTTSLAMYLSIRFNVFATVHA